MTPKNQRIASWPTKWESAQFVRAMQRDFLEVSQKGSAPIRDVFDDLVDARTLRYAAELLARSAAKKVPSVQRRAIRRDVLLKTRLDLQALQEQLEDGTYQPEPPIRRRERGGRRVVEQDWFDKWLAMAIYMLIGPIIRPRLHEGCFAIPRSLGLSSRDQIAAVQVARCLGMDHDFVVKLDITNFYPSFPHDPVMKSLRADLRDSEMRRLIRAMLFSVRTHRNKEIGLGQGTILAPILANVGLRPIDALFEPWGNLARSQEAHYFLRVVNPALIHPPASSVGRQKRSLVADCLLIRYVDDFLVLGSGGQARMDSILDLLTERLGGLGLSINPQKTVANDELKFDFLGFSFSPPKKRGRPLQIEISRHREEQILNESLRDIKRLDGSPDGFQRIVNKVTSKLTYFRNGGADTSKLANHIMGALKKEVGNRTKRHHLCSPPSGRQKVNGSHEAPRKRVEYLRNERIGTDTMTEVAR